MTDCTDKCKEAQSKYKKELADFTTKYPDFCRKCDGMGYICYQYDPSPPGVSLSSGSMEDCEPCPECEGSDEPVCGLCGKHLENERRICGCPYTCAPLQPECWCREANSFSGTQAGTKAISDAKIQT
jgi:hypothetical protein